MTADIESFDEVHVVSDLHLGGARGFQIFKEGARLAACIRGLAGREAPALALVLNGDTVDFLAEEPARYLDAANAVPKLERIMGDPAFSEVFSALRDFVAAPGRCLVIVLGNHDVELALPHVRTFLGGWLARGDAAALGRIRWAVDGAGFSCLVGGRRVLCVHGNEVDTWNVVDHRAILQTTRALARGVAAEEWKPNAGTRLVVDVMNGIKRQHPMIDLLKPEQQAAVPILLALDPGLAERVDDVLRAASRRAFDTMRMTAGFLGEEAVAEEDRLAPGEAVRRVLPARDADLDPTPLERRILDIQARIDRGERRRRPSMDGELATLGLSEWVSARGKELAEEGVPELLRVGLRRWLATDRSFDPSADDETSRALEAAVGASVHFLIAGHTHLRRALPRRLAGCFYYNTGTWIRLIQIKPKMLEQAAAFAAVYRALRAASLDELDRATAEGEPLVTTLPTVASVLRGDSGTRGVLQDVGQDGALTPVAKTQFRVPA